MNQWMTVLEIVAPIFAAVGLGVLAKRKSLISAEQMQGLQQYVMKFGLPCSYLSPSLGRNEEEYTVASGVCSILTVIALAAFCVMAAVVA